MHLFFPTHSRPYGLVKSLKKGFQVCKIKVGNLGILYKTELEGDPANIFLWCYTTLGF